MADSQELVLQGIIPPLVTPLLGNDELDVAGLERLVEHLIHGGVHGLFLLGTTGEGPSLSSRLQRQIVQAAVEMAAGRVPVLVAITSPSLREAIDLAEVSAVSGAQAVVSSTPYYYGISQDELLRYMHELVDAISLPLVLYNIPQRTHVKFEIETVRELVDVPSIIGMKDSSGDWDYLVQLLEATKHRPDFSILIGQEPILQKALEAGAHGAVSGSANVFPNVFAEFFEAFKRGDHARVDEQFASMAQVYELFYSGYRYSADGVAPLKYVLDQMGICQQTMAAPMVSFTAAQQEVFAGKLKSFCESQSHLAEVGLLAVSHAEVS
jgi:4-hydroxy-tetrahydrodipicolinate synthase